MSARTVAERRAAFHAAEDYRCGARVWRNSYAEGQLEDRLWRPFARGDPRGASRRIGAILKAARELERRSRRTRQGALPGARNGALGQIGLDVLEALYRRFLDWKTGRLEPAVASIAEAVGHSYSAVHDALRRLRDHGFLHWMRRSRATDNKGEAGPQVEQIPNAYILLLPPEIEKLVDRLTQPPPPPDCELWRREAHKAETDRMLAALSSSDWLKATWTGDPLLGETFARLAARLDAQERESGRASDSGGDKSP